MSGLRARLVGSSTARRRGCGELGTLTVRETRYVRAWTQLLDRHFDPSVARTACGRTYPVRSSDRTALPADNRRGTTGAHAAGREWSHR